MKFQKIFHYFNFVTTFAMFIILVFVITKAGGNRPYESLATSRPCGKVLHSIPILSEADNVRIALQFSTITN
jgi:hypothetical protein